MGMAGVAGVLPPSYVDFKELIRAEMLGVKAKMAELRKLHGQVGGPTCPYRLPAMLNGGPSHLAGPRGPPSAAERTKASKGVSPGAQWAR